jgi:hypothetical protein
MRSLMVARGHLGVVFSRQRQYEKSAEITRQALHLAPEEVGWYQNLANNALELQRFDEARQIAHEAEASCGRDARSRETS